MNAVVIEKFGPASVLQLKSINKPPVPDSSILVKVIAAGVNPVDTYVREGAFSNLPDLPFTPGKDGAGIIDKVGVNVTRFKPGQRVFVCGRSLGKYGTYAEYSLVGEDDIFPLDDKLGFEEGAALGIPYFTAYRALILKGQSSPGETVLIHGASGAVGLACVQIAKNHGLKVIGTAGTKEGMTLVEKTGADYVVSHKSKGYLEQIMELTENQGVNIIIEMLANVNLDKDFDLLATKGRVMIIGSRGPVKIDPRKTMGPELQVVGVALLSSTKAEWEITTKAILDGICDGWIKPVIDKRYLLAEVQSAHKDIISSPGAKGKLVLTVQAP